MPLSILFPLMFPQSKKQTKGMTLSDLHLHLKMNRWSLPESFSELKNKNSHLKERSRRRKTKQRVKSLRQSQHRIQSRLTKVRTSPTRRETSPSLTRRRNKSNPSHKRNKVVHKGSNEEETPTSEKI